MNPDGNQVPGSVARLNLFGSLIRSYRCRPESSDNDRLPTVGWGIDVALAHGLGEEATL
jgi:hypothetical protein